MQFTSNIIQIIIYLNILFSLLCITRILIHNLAKRYTSVKQYKITHWGITFFYAYFYIIGIVIGLYCLRLYNINHTLDLKILYHNFINILDIVINISYVYTIPGIILIVIILLITLNLLLTMILGYKSLNNQLFNLYLFIRYNPHERQLYDKLGYKFKKFLEIYHQDIISFCILETSHYFSKRLTYYQMDLIWEKNPDIYSSKYDEQCRIFYKCCEQRPWYHFNNIISCIMGSKFYQKIIVPFSPIFFITYDCAFNNFIITHVYYYLLFFIPLMLYRKFTMTLSYVKDYIGELIWDILYKHETCIYALPKDHRKLFDVYIANGIKTIYFPPPALIDHDVSCFIHRSAKFEYNYQAKLYYNGVDRSLEILPGNRYVYQYTDYDTQEEIQEEWFLIAIKYSDENKHETIYIDI